MKLSRLSSKGQVTIPKAIRESIGVEPGDLIAYEIHDGRVTLTRVGLVVGATGERLTATLDEWNTLEDEEAFHDL